MRPVKLKIQAFGPYAKTEWIDFTELGNRTMFVIAGETGAGKTTIFDAISYAIYGVASGDDRETDDLRSHLASEDLLTEVEFEFSLHNKNYRIVRSPKQKKKKVKGDGYTEVGSKAELFVLQEEKWELLAYQLTDVDQKMRQLIGLDKEQFRQILMIPQGEFRKLLVSDSKDKEKILQKLFNTYLYSKIEDILKNKSKELRTDLEKLNQKQQMVFSMIKAVIIQELVDFVEKGQLEYYQIMPLLEQELEKQREEQIRLTTELQLVEDKLALQNKELFLATELMKKFESVTILKEQYNELQKQEASIKDKEQLVKSIENAQLLQRDEEIGKNYNAQEARLNKELETKSIDLATSMKQLDHLKEQYEQHFTHQQEIDDKKQQIQRLTILKGEVENLQQLQQEVEQLAKSMNENQVQINELQQEETKQKQALENIEQQITEIQAIKDKCYKLDQEVMIDKKRLKLVEDLHKESIAKQEALQKIEKQETLKKEEEAKMLQLKEQLTNYENQMLHSQAAILATSLKEGCACPVCGSVEHPNVATFEDEVPKKEILEELRAKHDQLMANVQAISNVLVNEKWKVDFHQKRIEELNEELGISTDELTKEIEYLSAVIKEKENNLKQHRTILSNEEKLLANAQLIKKQLVQVEKTLQVLIPALQDNKLQHQLKVEQIQQLLNKLPKTIQSADEFYVIFNALQKEITAYDTKLKQLETFIQTEKEQQSALINAKDILQNELTQVKGKLAEHRENFRQTMLSLGFENGTEYKLAASKIAEKEEIKKKIDEFKLNYQSVSVRLKDLQDELATKEKPNVSSINEQIQLLEKTIKELRVQLSTISNYIVTNENTIVQTNQLRTEIGEMEEEYKIIGELSDIASGKNEFKISFERYVLGYFLDEILLEANIRLNKMTNGRYELIRKTDLHKTRGAAGLDLLVIDQYSGRERPVRTLSGGESFKASLALALGLSDVVSQNAGGISMETIFIDEGFGTLDNESLNQAIDTLMEIQSSGRLVGIISHVDQLKESIDARLEVFSTTTGSHTRFVFSTTT